MSYDTWPRRFRQLTPEDAALVAWIGDGHPPSLAPLASRLARSGFSVLDVNRGWWPLVKRLDQDIAAVAPRYRVNEIDEDLGVLVFRISPANLSEVVESLIWDAQDDSTRTCATCADRAWLYRDGDWLVTLCIDHARARGARPAKTDADILEAVPRRSGRGRAVRAGEGLSPWADIVGPCYTGASLGRVLEISGVEIAAAVAELRLLRLRTDDDVDLFPAFQVRDGGVHPDLPQVLFVLRGGIDDPWTWAQWLNAPDADGMRPIEQLWSGELAEVLEEAGHDAGAWRS